MSEKMWTCSPDVMRGELRYAVAYLSAQKLTESAKWYIQPLEFRAGELLVSIEAVPSQPEKMEEARSFNKPYVEEFNEATDILNLARVLFDLREYRKCMSILKPFAIPAFQSAMFLYYYSSYLISEQERSEEIYESGGKSSDYILP